MGHLPGFDPAALDGSGHAGALRGKRPFAHRALLEPDSVGGVFFIEEKTVIPGRGRADLEVAVGELAQGLVGVDAVPGLVDLEGIDEGAAFDRQRLVVTEADQGPHREAQGHFDGPLPFPLDAVEGAGLQGFLFSARDAGGRAFGPGRDPQDERKAGRPVGPDRDLQRLPERVVGLHFCRDRYAPRSETDFAGRVGRRGQTLVGRLHPKMGGELGPALVHVGRAAAEVRLQSIKVGFRAVGRPHMVGIERALDLVDLLVVLVGPHLRAERRRQGVEGHPLQAVSEDRVAEDGEQDLQGIHELHDRAQLGALDRVLSGQAFVAGEHSRNLAVMAVQDSDHAGGKGRIGLGNAEAPG